MKYLTNFANFGRFDKHTLLIRVAVVIGINLVYAFAFTQLYPSLGDATGSISIVPTAVTGSLLGLKFGLVGGLFNFLINEVLYNYFSPTVHILSVQSIPGLIFSVASSGIIGGLSDLLYHTRKQAHQIEQQRCALVLEMAQRRQTEEALIQARDQALTANRAKSHLLAKVSHELRTPLGAVLGFAELLFDGYQGSVTEGQKQALADIIDSTNYLTELINELLDQSQLDSIGVKLNLAPLNIKEMMQQAELRMRILAEAKGLNLQVTVAADLPETLIGDQYRLQQIITNLVGNAIKFTKAGEIQLRGYRVDQRNWMLQVSDTGPGIPAEAQADIFKAFHQLNSSLANNNGTGLGLSIVKQLVMAMNGQITVESKVGYGSTFTVSLPLVTILEKTT